MIPPKIRLVMKACSVVCMQASKDFAQKGANLGLAQGTPYQKPKTHRIWPTIFYKACIFSFFFSIILFYLSITIRRGERDVPTPLAASLQLGASTPRKLTTDDGVNIAINTPY